jgi:mono/diheme cytochrome c family protein
MRPFLLSQRLVCVGTLVLALSAFALTATPRDGATTAESRAVSYLREVRPILTQHCFQCHGPDEAARKGKLRLDLKELAYAERDGLHVIAPGNLDESLVWQRVTAEENGKRMPPDGKAEPLTKKQIETLKAWIEQGAKWEDHWSFLPPIKPPLPTVSDKVWVRDSVDAFVLARLDREGLKPESEATREAWLRRASFDLTGLPPTPAEIDEFLKDKSSDAYEKQADRLLASRRYGERQAQEWLDLARYADTSGYQNDLPRKIWKWREWVINAYNANMPFDQFTIEQLAGDLLPNATLAQRIATGFNRNHPTNSEAGEEEDEYRSAYVIDRVNTTATVFMGLTLACAQCHDHKYDPISQRDYYSFYSFFNNVKERDSDFLSPRPTLPVPNPDQEPRLADLKARIAALKERLERDDPLMDVAQKEWEAKTLARVSAPVNWTTVLPTALLSRNGSQLKMLDDNSVQATGAPPVKDTYDVMVLPGKKHITALRLEVIPDDSQPEKALGRSSDGRFNLTAIEIRHTSLADAQDPPLVYVSRAEADLNQKPKEEPSVNDMFPGPIESAIVIEPVGGPGGFGFRGGGWSIVDDERKKPHEAIFLPLEPLDTNDVSVLRFSLHQSGGKFRSLIGRFRISYTEDDRIRELLLPAQTKLWSSIGPFPAEDVTKAFTTAFEPEKDIKAEPLDLKKNYTKVVLPPAANPSSGKDKSSPKGKTAERRKTEAGAPKAAAAKSESKATPREGTEKSEAAPPSTKVAEKPSTERANSRSKAEDDPAKARATDKSKSERSKESKDTAEAKPSGKSKAKGQAAKAGDKAGDGKQKDKPKAEKITWAEQRTWRDGSPARLQGANAAYYLTRKIVSTRPRTVTVQIDGPAGFKMWLNGEAVQALAPPPPPAPPKPGAKPEEPPAAADIETFDIDQVMGRARSKTEKRFRIGLRQGENEIVLKVVFAGGGTPARLGPVVIVNGVPNAMGGPGGGVITFNVTPEGDDVVTHEVVTALRLEARERATTARAADPKTPPATQPAPAPVGDAKQLPPAPDARHSSDAATAEPAAPSKPDEPKKVSLVGEKSAAPKAPDENKLTPSERRRKVLREHFRSNIDPIGRVLAEELAKLKDEEKQLKREIPETLVMEELEKPRDAHVFIRGLYKNLGDKVSATTPAVLPPLSKYLPHNRLGLAKWIASGQHPLTARVLVNRIWQQYFGIGLVRTAEDFGIRGEPPTHPELLDYLATELVDSKWDLKKLHRRIVLSATYRQASAVSKEKMERDPENRLIARGPRLRLTAEMVRDNALAVSGLLHEQIGGESVKPVQPENAWKTVEGGPFASGYRRDRDEKQYRRSLYVYWKRGSPYPSMLNFDAVKRDACTVTRATTTTPLQALTLLNDPAYVEFAKILGQRMMKGREALGRARDLKKPEEEARRLAYGFRLCTSRPPTEDESRILKTLLDDQRAHFTADAAAAKKLLAVGDAKIDEALDAAEAAAWASVGNALLNLDATIHR